MNCPHCGKEIQPPSTRVCYIHTESSIASRRGEDSFLRYSFNLNASIPKKKWEKIIRDALSVKYRSFSINILRAHKEKVAGIHVWSPEEVVKEIWAYCVN